MRIRAERYVEPSLLLSISELLSFSNELILLVESKIGNKSFKENEFRALIRNVFKLSKSSKKVNKIIAQLVNNKIVKKSKENNETLYSLHPEYEKVFGLIKELMIRINENEMFKGLELLSEKRFLGYKKELSLLKEIFLKDQFNNEEALNVVRFFLQFVGLFGLREGFSSDLEVTELLISSRGNDSTLSQDSISKSIYLRIKSDMHAPSCVLEENQSRRCENLCLKTIRDLCSEMSSEDMKLFLVRNPSELKVNCWSGNNRKGDSSEERGLDLEFSLILQILR